MEEEKEMVEEMVKEVIKEVDKEEQLQENVHEKFPPPPSISVVQKRGHKLCLLTMLTQ